MTDCVENTMQSTDHTDINIFEGAPFLQLISQLLASRLTILQAKHPKKS